MKRFVVVMSAALMALAVSKESAFSQDPQTDPNNNAVAMDKYRVDAYRNGRLLRTLWADTKVGASDLKKSLLTQVDYPGRKLSYDEVTITPKQRYTAPNSPLYVPRPQ